MPAALKLTDEATQLLCAALRAGAGMEQAARAVASQLGYDSLTGRAVYKRMESDDAFRQMIDDARDYATDRVEKRLFDACMKGNPALIPFYLCNRRPDAWKSVTRRAEEFGDDAPIGEVEIRFVHGVDKTGQPVNGKGNGANGGGMPDVPRE